MTILRPTILSIFVLPKEQFIVKSISNQKDIARLNVYHSQ